MARFVTPCLALLQINMAAWFGGSKKTKKTCEKCRYFKKRYTGSYNLGYTISHWGQCEGNEKRDLTGRGLKFLGLVHKNMECQLPNIGKPADWKDFKRIPRSHKKNMFWSAHPKAFSKHHEGDAEWRRNREWQLERQKELKEQGKAV